MKRFLATLFSFTSILLSIVAQNQLTGSVNDANFEPIIGAELRWKGTGIGAITDVDGRFEINRTEANDTLEISYVGYATQTKVIAPSQLVLTIVLEEDTKLLDEVEVAARAVAVVSNRFSAIQTQKLTGAELCKAACCNLSESFETNASVDVAFADAATGAKTIKMLGLSGTYVQLLSENTPGVRGLAQTYGMEYTPGAWMESIQVSKGTASVINGYEATTGQINVEYLKPQLQDPIAVNAMISSTVRAEVNLTGGWAVDDKCSVGILAHYKNELLEHDSEIAKGKGKDGFLDLPKTQQLNVLNRWYIKTGNYTGQVLVRGLYDERNGGQTKQYVDNPYRIGINTWRLDAFTKHGFVFDEEKGTSIGTIFSGSYHNVNSTYGHRLYDAAQGNFYMNLLFQTNFTDDHKLTVGLSTNFDHYTELLHATDNETFVRNADVVSGLNMDRWEVTPGVFAEYSYKFKENLSVLLGVRGDWSSTYGFFATPRFNVRYSPFEWWNLRASVGLGYRSPNLLSDQAQFLPSSRHIYLDAERLNQERALNAGLSTTFFIPIDGRELQISADYYYTNFFECTIADMDMDAHQVHFYNLSDVPNGRSYAGNFQIEAQMEILKGWTMDVAFRYSDVKTSYKNIEGVREKPLTNRFKALITTSYVTPLKHWQFDVTAQFNGGGRMPDPHDCNWAEEFPWHPSLMAQVTRYFRTWSVYVGGENLTNFKMSDRTSPDGPIIGWQNPYGPNFDASMAWGPIHGWMLYAGFRWSINKK